jgi:hypothetical protein
MLLLLLTLIIKYKKDTFSPTTVKKNFCEIVQEDFEVLANLYGIRHISDSNLNTVYDESIQLKAYKQLIFSNIMELSRITSEEIYR